jgi:hypothetical protein
MNNLDSGPKGEKFIPAMNLPIKSGFQKAEWCNQRSGIIST